MVLKKIIKDKWDNKYLKFANFELNFGGKGGAGVNSEAGFEHPDHELAYGGDDLTLKKSYDFTILNFMNPKIYS